MFRITFLEVRISDTDFELCESSFPSQNSTVFVVWHSWVKLSKYKVLILPSLAKKKYQRVKVKVFR